MPPRMADKMCRSCGSNIQGNYAPHLCSVRVNGRWMQRLPELTAEEKAEYVRYFEAVLDTLCESYHDEDADCSCGDSAAAAQWLEELSK